jgi:hypothetical protein
VIGGRESGLWNCGWLDEVSWAVSGGFFWIVILCVEDTDDEFAASYDENGKGYNAVALIYDAVLNIRCYGFE